MDAHENARTTPHSRRLIVDRLRDGQGVGEIAAVLGVSSRTVRRWRDRFATEGEAGLRNRSSRPRHSPTRPNAGQHASIEALRRQRLSGPAIARQLGLPVSTVGTALRRLGLGRLSALDPPRQVIRYERERPGELVHIDIKKLGRIDGIGHRISNLSLRRLVDLTPSFAAAANCASIRMSPHGGSGCSAGEVLFECLGGEETAAGIGIFFRRRGLTV